MIAEHSWIIEGGRVAEFTGEIGYADVTFTTIERFTPLWIVLANGERYYRTTLRAFGTAAQDKELMSADDDRVRDVHAHMVLVHVSSKVSRSNAGAGWPAPPTFCVCSTRSAKRCTRQRRRFTRAIHSSSRDRAT